MYKFSVRGNMVRIERFRESRIVYAEEFYLDLRLKDPTRRPVEGKIPSSITFQRWREICNEIQQWIPGKKEISGLWSVGYLPVLSEEAKTLLGDLGEESIHSNLYWYSPCEDGEQFTEELQIYPHLFGELNAEPEFVKYQAW